MKAKINVRLGLLLVVAAIALVAIVAGMSGNIPGSGSRVAVVAAPIPSTGSVATGASMSNLLANPASLPAQPSKSQEAYCAPGTYRAHYYNNYYGNKDSREFFYFERDWFSRCGGESLQK